MRRVSAYVVQIKLFVIVNNDGIKINVDVNVKKLIDKGVCDKEYIWNPSNCECKCDKSCNIGEYLDYSDCKCRKKLVDKLIDECNETTEEVKLANIIVENENSYYKCSSCKVYIVFMIVVFTIFTGITIYFVYHKYVHRNKHDLPY